MNALTGNTTDLRIAAALIKYLQSKGYHNLLLAEGTNSGFFRREIDVADRLRYRRLASHFNIEFRDLNKSGGRNIRFEGGTMAKLADECFEADVFINVPKLKCHYETGISACMKNIMGCLVGLSNKKKTHESLALNIVNIYRNFKPSLNIIDGIIAMEGNGPSDGTPVNMGLVIAGLDSLKLDVLLAKLIGFEIDEVKPLKTARDIGLLRQRDIMEIERIDISPYKRSFRKPNVSFLLKLISNPRLQKYFQMIRETTAINQFCNSPIGDKTLVAVGIRQEIFTTENDSKSHLVVHKERSDNSTAPWREYCPLGLDIVEDHGRDIKCLDCFYCSMVCQNNEIEIVNKPLFLQIQDRKYGDLIKGITSRTNQQESEF
jgi:uncharacterized protein (DUF362 family)